MSFGSFRYYSSNYIERFGEDDKNIDNVEFGEYDGEGDESYIEPELELHETPAALHQELWEKYQKLCHLLPERELDMIEMSILYEKDQTNIGKVFKVSQGDVSYRIKRLKERLQYLLSLPEINYDIMKDDLSKLLEGELTNILMLLLKYTSQSKVGKMLGLSQGKIRHRYIRSLQRIEKECYRNPKFLIYFDLLSKLQGNYNSLRTLSVQDRWKYKY